MNLSPRAPSEGRWVRHLFPLVFANQNLQKLLGFKLHPEVPVPAPGGSIIFQAATFPADPVRGRLSGVFEKAWATSRMKTQISLGDCQSKTNCLPLNKRLWFLGRETLLSDLVYAVNYSTPKGPKGLSKRQLCRKVVQRRVCHKLRDARSTAHKSWTLENSEQIVSTQLLCPSRHVNQLSDKISLSIKINRRQSQF